MKFPIEIVPFLGEMLVFRGGGGEGKIFLSLWTAKKSWPKKKQPSQHSLARFVGLKFVSYGKNTKSMN